jgi:hypothetical protein
MTDDTPDTPTSKYCLDCGAEWPIGEFYRSKATGSPGGYRYSAYCKTHAKARSAATAKNAPEGSKTREAIRRASRTWKQRHPEQRRAQAAARYARKKAQADAPPPGLPAGAGSSSGAPTDDQAD